MQDAWQIRRSFFCIGGFQGYRDISLFIETHKITLTINRLSIGKNIRATAYNAPLAGQKPNGRLSVDEKAVDDLVFDARTTLNVAKAQLWQTIDENVGTALQIAFGLFAGILGLCRQDKKNTGCNCYDQSHHRPR